MLERIAKTITRYSMFQPRQRVGVAVSGGADSVCLLYVLHELAPRWDLRLTALHLDHRLRGGESRQDAEFVRELAAALDLPCEVQEADVAALCRDSGDNLEQAARAARLRFFARVRQSGAIDRIATGHTRSDQAETVLFRFLRGSGTAGLAGIRPVTAEGVVRPLIEIDRPEIEQYLRERGITWRTDSTNASDAFARNRIRRHLLPQLTEDWNPALTGTLAHTADWAQAEEAYWDVELARLVPEHFVFDPPAILIRTKVLAGLRTAVARRLIRRAVELAKGDLRGVAFEHLAGILELATSSEGHGRLQIPSLDIFRSFEWLRIAPPTADNLETRNYRFPLPVPGAVRLPGQKRVLHTELFDNTNVTETSGGVYNGGVGYLDWCRISGPLEVRNWRPGDQYQPADRSGAEKIKALFHEGRVPLWERRGWPIVTVGDQILWARRFGPSAGMAARSGAGPVLGIRETGL
ncbi:MAG TPA: tRNA lysidine(34) synthetase TilS [Bryobacteraceae bacterium]|nr:tRNA lysidine(34) synthetase TilS [Bryobacteraceae bacterium]